MRVADNFHPEWGYLAPAPRFMRTVRIVVVAAAVGACAGGAVVFSLSEIPAAEDVSVAARTLAQPSDSAVASSALPPALLQAAATQGRPQLPAQPRAQIDVRAASVQPNRLAAAESTAQSTTQRPASAAALAEVPATAATVASQPITAAVTADAANAPKKPAKKQPLAWRSAPREPIYGSARAPLALLPAGGYQERGEF